jgi:predicted DNA-binding antitoxin AbrB/MazE fold protein
MTIETSAIYENGLLRPRAPLPFAERQEVRLRIEPAEHLETPKGPSVEQVEQILDAMAEDAPDNLPIIAADLSREDFYEDRN